MEHMTVDECENGRGSKGMVSFHQGLSETLLRQTNTLWILKISFNEQNILLQNKNIFRCANRSAWACTTESIKEATQLCTDRICSNVPSTSAVFKRLPLQTIREHALPKRGLRFLTPKQASVRYPPRRKGVQLASCLSPYKLTNFSLGVPAS